MRQSSEVYFAELCMMPLCTENTVANWQAVLKNEVTKHHNIS
jgi:hypothetical protein